MSLYQGISDFYRGTQNGYFLFDSYLYLRKTLIIERFYIKLTENIDYSTKI